MANGTAPGSVGSWAVAGRHRGQAASEPGSAEAPPAALEHAFSREDQDPARRSPAALLAGVGGLVAIVLVAVIALMVREGGSGGPVIRPTSRSRVEAAGQ